MVGEKKERRSGERKAACLDLELLFCGAQVSGQTKNIGKGGALVSVEGAIRNFITSRPKGIGILSEANQEGSLVQRVIGVEFLEVRCEQEDKCEAAIRFLELPKNQPTIAQIRKALFEASKKLFLDYHERTISFALEHLLQEVCVGLGATRGLLYLADEYTLAPADEKRQTPEFEPRLVLAARYQIDSLKECPSLLPYPPSWQGAAEDHLLGDLLPKIKNESWVRFHSRKVILAHGEILVSMPDSSKAALDFIRPMVVDFFSSTIPSLEALFRRQLWRESCELVELGSSVLIRAPREQFREPLQKAVTLLGAEGGSLFVKGASQQSSRLQLVATYPKTLGHEVPSYSLEDESPTTHCVRLAKECIIRDVDEYRRASLDMSQPVWCDIEDDAKPRTMMLAFHRTLDQSLYVLRCTNSTSNPSRHFHELDIQRARHMVLLLSVLHRALENEYRALRIFLDITHDFNQKMQSMVSAADYVIGSLNTLKRNPRSFNWEECRHKLSNIQNTARLVSAAFDAVNYPAPTVQEATDDVGQFSGFKPYADVVKPVCEMFRADAAKRSITLTIHGGDQLGLVYMPIADLRRIVENLMVNAVKYTYPNSEILVALRRRSTQEGGGGYLDFISKSLPIFPDEIERIFDFKYRGRAAREAAKNGDGLGLALSSYLIQRYGGTIRLRITDDFNIFSVFLPSHLFMPPALGRSEKPKEPDAGDAV
jgi:hypothetical protein